MHGVFSFLDELLTSVLKDLFQSEVYFCATALHGLKKKKKKIN